MKEKDDILTFSMEKVGQELIHISTKKNLSAENALNNFLDFALRAFDIGKILNSTSYDEWREKILEEDTAYTSVLMRWMHDVNFAISDGKSCDFFGGIYEAMFQGKGKASRTGQFFTPMSLCRLMSSITKAEDKNGILRISDPCCGSGRLLLGHFESADRSKGHIYIGEDIDPTSCKMTALNLMVHCCFGVVICHDVLLNNPPHLVYLVNECQVPYYNPTMCIRTLEGEEAEKWWSNGGVDSLERYYDIPENTPEKEAKWVQKSLFD